MSWSSPTTRSLRPSPCIGDFFTLPLNQRALQPWPPLLATRASEDDVSSFSEAERTSTSTSCDMRSAAAQPPIGSRRDQMASTSTAQLGEALKLLRHQRGHSLIEVSRGTGISRSFLSLVESGRSDITIGRLLRLVTFYGAQISDLLPQDEAHDPIVVKREEQRE